MMKGMIFAERYQLEDFIGQGGMSLVYRAVDIRTGHSVAVKILKSEYNSDKEFLERFQREAQAASLMSVRILSALQHAHDNGIIHRDIKPQNVLIHSDGHVKVADFGIARMTNAFTISKGDTVVGSVHYSSPEQAMGGVVEATSDIYSTGVVMYEMLTGRVPFVGDTPVSVAMQHINDAPPPITDYAPETPPAVVAVVMKALAKNPKDRFQSAREMADALLQAKDGKLDPETLQTGFSRLPGDQPGHCAGRGGLHGGGGHGDGQTRRAGLAADRAEQRPHPRRGGDLPAAGAGHGNEPGRQPAGHRQSGPQSGYHPRLRGAAV